MGEHGENRVRSGPDPMHVALEGGVGLSGSVYLVLNYFLNLSEYSGGGRQDPGLSISQIPPAKPGTWKTAGCSKRLERSHASYYPRG
jgi:hypothetical protein